MSVIILLKHNIVPLFLNKSFFYKCCRYTNKIVRLNSSSDTYLTTTSPMSLSVEMPFFYLSPSEYNWISQLHNIRVKYVKCKVVMRNPRTTFETNASTSTS